MIAICLLAKVDPTPHRGYGHNTMHNETASESLHRLFKFNLGKKHNKGTLLECF